MDQGRNNKDLKSTVEKLRGENRRLREELATLRKESQSVQRALRESRLLWENLPNAVVLIQRGKIVFANEAAWRHLDLSAEGILGKNFLDFVHPRSLEFVENLHGKRISGKPVPDRYEAYLQSMTGRPKCCEVRVKKIRHQGRRAFLVSLIGLDERKKREWELRRSEKMEAVARMAAGLSNEFSGILGLIDDVRMNLQRQQFHSDARVAESSEELGDAVKRGKHVVQQLNMLVPSENKESGATLLDLMEIVQDAVTATQPSWRKESGYRGVEINVKTYLRPLSLVEGRREEIREVFVNMILNAIASLLRGGEIYVSTEESAGFANVHVQDNGSGIPQDVREEIFDPFLTHGDGFSSGMRLSLAQAIVRRHGGEIEVVSEEGLGTTFTVRLPVAQRVSPRKSKRVRKKIRDVHTLIISGEGMMKNLLIQLFASKGGKVTAASTPREGLHSVKRGNFDLVLVDLDTPNLDMARLIVQLKKMSPRLAVGLIKSAREGSSFKEWDHRGVDFLIDRPVDLDKILILACQALKTGGSNP